MPNALDDVRVAFAAVDAETLPLPDLLLAAESLSRLYDVMFPQGGRIPALLKSDHLGHVDATRRIHQNNAICYSTVEGLMLGEIRSAGGVERLRGDWAYGTVNLLWIFRTSSFVLVFLEKLCDSGSAPYACARESYAETISPYHTWVMSVALRVALGLVPSRDTLHGNLGLSEDDASVHIRGTTKVLRPVTERLGHLLREHRCDFDDKIGF